jgi:hypothetical protein
LELAVLPGICAGVGVAGGCRRGHLGVAFALGVSDAVAKCRRQEFGLPRGLSSLSDLTMRPPLTRSRPLFSLVRRPAGLGPCVCGTPRPVQPERAPRPGPRRSRSRSHGHRVCASGLRRDLQPAELLLRQRRLLVGVVLFAGQHSPEQHGEFPGGRDDRSAGSTPALGALIERVQRPGLKHRAPRGLNQCPARGS